MENEYSFKNKSDYKKGSIKKVPISMRKALKLI
jgi:hypothetical protein